MFGKDYDFSLIRTTSKEALKRTALLVSGNDIKKATEIYDFFVKDIQLPDTDPILPSTFDQIKQTAVGALQWSGENKDKIIDAANFVLTMFGKNPIEVPPVAAEMPAPPPIV